MADRPARARDLPHPGIQVAAMAGPADRRSSGEPWARWNPLLWLVCCLPVVTLFTLAFPEGGPRLHAAQTATTAWFTDRAAEAGLDFVHFNGMSGEFYFAEIMPPGVALFDYDADGDLDLFVAQGRMLGTKATSQAFHPPKGPLGSRLYRNDLTVGANLQRTLRFTDVTDASGITTPGYAMGAATGDYDNDGCVDLYVTSLRRSQLFRNNCDGTFTDVTEASGTGHPGWSISAAFLDYDRDGWLDLFVGNYVAYSVEKDQPCLHSISIDYCPPSLYRSEPDLLFHNNGDGTFTDVTAAAGMSGTPGPSLGVSTADFDGDGWIDIFVASDGQANRLWINGRDGTFEDTGLFSGTAFGESGEAEGSMGVDAGDFDNDGDEDLFMTELLGEGHDLYINDGTGLFENGSARAGIRLPSLPYTGFGAAWLDFDNDGWLDVLTVNGAVRHTMKALAANERFAVQQRNQLFRNLGNRRFEDVTAQAGAAFEALDVSRGAAFGDLDNDGDTDVVVANDSGPLRLLINDLGSASPWLGLRLVGRQAPRDMIGARVAVERTGGPTIWRRARSDGSYASANDPRVLVGLGEAATVTRVRVYWPGGQVEEWTDIPVNRYTTLREGGAKR